MIFPFSLHLIKAAATSSRLGTSLLEEIIEKCQQRTAHWVITTTAELSGRICKQFKSIKLCRCSLPNPRAAKTNISYLGLNELASLWLILTLTDIREF